MRLLLSVSSINNCILARGFDLLVTGRRHLASENGSVLDLGAFLPSWDMARTCRAKVAAALRHIVRWIEVGIGPGHTSARRFTGGSADKPLPKDQSRNFDHGAHGLFDLYVPALCNTRSLRTLPGQSGQVVLYLVFALAGGGSVVARRVLDVKKSRVLHDYLLTHDISPEWREQLKVTPRLMRAAITVYGLLGISVIHLTAGLSAGGRLWPKYGFLPLNAKQWLQCRPRIISNLENMPPSVQARHKSFIHACVNNPDPLSIRAIYRLEDMVPDVIDPDRQRRLGQVLLTGTRWKGFLDLRDRSSQTYLQDAIRADEAGPLGR